jgi:hypothetical protein
MMLHLHPSSYDDEACISMLEGVVGYGDGDLAVVGTVREVILEVGLPKLFEVVVEAHDGPAGGDDDEDLLPDVGVPVRAVEVADGHGYGSPARCDADVVGEEGDFGHDAGLVETRFIVQVAGVGRLEDLDLGFVCGEEDLRPAVAVEVGDEGRGEAVDLVLDGEVLVGEVVPGLTEEEVAVVVKGEEDGERRQKKDSQIPLPHPPSPET